MTWLFGFGRIDRLTWLVVLGTFNGFDGLRRQTTNQSVLAILIKSKIINFYNYKRKIIQNYPILSYPISFSILAIAYAFITFSAVSIGRI